MRRLILGLALFGFALLVADVCTRVDDPSLLGVNPSTDAFEPPEPLPHSELRNVFWGDLHIHSSYSYDAYTFGVRAMPDDAYRFAKGARIEHGAGYPVQLSQPLDFAAVTDHAVYLGVARQKGDRGDRPLHEILATGQPWRITLNYLRIVLGRLASVEAREASFGGEPVGEVSLNAWQDIVTTAERHNEPGRFTTFIAYEWTSMPRAENLHRNVIYRSSAAPKFPFSSLDSEDPEDLWAALENQRRKGMETLSIPHNANVSNGRMYSRVRFDGSPMTAAYAETRMKNEPISEILQVKGQSEVHPLLASDDEFADFEIYDQILSAEGTFSQPRGSYSRDALKTGLELSALYAFNPYRFGVIGSSDSHNASSPVEEGRYHGKLPLQDGTAGLRLGQTLWLPDRQNRGARWSAMGLAAVWAEQNTRESLFDAMRRKETYAISGPRIVVRLFGGWQFEPALLRDPGFVAQGYARGVPMGGILPPRIGEAAPRFAVVALKDPTGANLDRIQIVKGWLDSDGTARERIFDIAASDGRLPDPKTRRVSPVGNTVKLEDATYSNEIGAAQLEAVWSDPDFDASAEAFYYVRVIEIPTPRWSTYDAVLLGIEPPEPATLQERAITSAIWYQPTR
ncbi:MAG: DUF3604 domain-containing protein [bacterium]|nr:DUF3604 domain-containing protein [bacterium]